MPRALLCLSLCFYLSCPAGLLAAEFAVVTHPDNPVSSLSREEVRELFLGKKAFWPNGTAVTLLVQEHSPAHATFCQKILRKTPQQFFTYWRKKLFSGAAELPTSLDGDERIKAAVAAHPAAIAYIAASAVDPRVKLIEVE